MSEDIVMRSRVLIKKNDYKGKLLFWSNIQPGDELKIEAKLQRVNYRGGVPYAIVENVRTREWEHISYSSLVSKFYKFDYEPLDEC